MEDIKNILLRLQEEYKLNPKREHTSIISGALLLTTKINNIKIKQSEIRRIFGTATKTTVIVCEELARELDIECIL